jgi:hypothetical protein
MTQCTMHQSHDHDPNQGRPYPGGPFHVLEEELCSIWITRTLSWCGRL